MTEDRRKPDPRLDSLQEKVDHLHDCMEEVKKDIIRNTEITEQVRDILTSFTVVGKAAKWIGGVAAACAAVWAMLKGFRA